MVAMARVCPPPPPAPARKALPSAPGWTIIVLPTPDLSKPSMWCDGSGPEPDSVKPPSAPGITLKSVPSAPPPNVDCYTLAYLSAEVRLACDECFDGVAVVVPEGAFTSRTSQAEADAQAQAYAESLLSCIPIDPGAYIPSASDTGEPVALSPVDVYGLLGFSSLSAAGEIRRFWCGNLALDFCDGPEDDGVTPASDAEWYSTRWRAMQDGGVFSYSKVGEDWETAPSDLFPSAVSDAVGVSISFDANARPCFAFQRGGSTVEIRRFVAGSPTVYSWTGESPKLFYNGIVQRELDERDVVCYYVRNGALCARFQRDAFGTEYILLTAEACGSIASLVKADRGSAAGRDSFVFLSAVRADGSLVLLESGPYQPWPVLASDSCRVSAMPAGGSYWPILIVLPAVREAIGVSATPAGGEYRAIRITVPTITEAIGLSAAPSPTGNRYWPIRIDAGTYHESVGLAAAPAPTGNRYWLVRVNAGTYQDHFTLSATPAGGTYAPV